MGHSVDIKNEKKDEHVDDLMRKELELQIRFLVKIGHTSVDIVGSLDVVVLSSWCSRICVRNHQLSSD